MLTKSELRGLFFILFFSFFKQQHQCFFHMYLVCSSAPRPKHSHVSLCSPEMWDVYCRGDVMRCWLWEMNHLTVSRSVKYLEGGWQAEMGRRVWGSARSHTIAIAQQTFIGFWTKIIRFFFYHFESSSHCFLWSKKLLFCICFRMLLHRWWNVLG